MFWGLFWSGSPSNPGLRIVRWFADFGIGLCNILKPRSDSSMTTFAHRVGCSIAELRKTIAHVKRTFPGGDNRCLGPDDVT